MTIVIYKNRKGTEWRMAELGELDVCLDSKQIPMRVVSHCEDYTWAEAREVLRQLEQEEQAQRLANRRWRAIGALTLALVVLSVVLL